MSRNRPSVLRRRKTRAVLSAPAQSAKGAEPGERAQPGPALIRVLFLFSTADSNRAAAGPPGSNDRPFPAFLSLLFRNAAAYRSGKEIPERQPVVPSLPSPPPVLQTKPAPSSALRTEDRRRVTHQPTDRPPPANTRRIYELRSSPHFFPITTAAPRHQPRGHLRHRRTVPAPAAVALHSPSPRRGSSGKALATAPAPGRPRRPGRGHAGFSRARGA